MSVKVKKKCNRYFKDKDGNYTNILTENYEGFRAWMDERIKNRGKGLKLGLNKKSKSRSKYTPAGVNKNVGQGFTLAKRYEQI